MTSKLFSEAQLKELEEVFGLTAVKPKQRYKLRDGTAAEGDTVWWRNHDGPVEVQLVGADLENCIMFPNVYQIKKPRVEYIDE